MCEFLVEGLDPFRNAGLPGVDLLTATDQAYDRCPILPLIQRPNKEGCFGVGEILDLEFVAVGSSAFELICEPLVGP